MPVLRFVDVRTEDAIAVADAGGELDVGHVGGCAFDPEACVEMGGDVGVTD